MRVFIGFILCLLLNLDAVSGADLVQWQTDYNKAQSLSKEQKRPLFVYFYGNDCPPCRALETEVFANAELAVRLNREFIPVKIDVAAQPALAKQMSVTAIPTDIVFSVDGQVVQRRQGGIKPERFGQYLDFLAGKLAVPTPIIPSASPSLNPSVLAAMQNTPQNIPSQNIPAAPNNTAVPNNTKPVAVQSEPTVAVQNPVPVTEPKEQNPVKQPPLDPFASLQQAQQTQPSPELNAAAPVSGSAVNTPAPAVNAPFDPFTTQQTVPVAKETAVAAAPVVTQNPPNPQNPLPPSTSAFIPQPPLNISEIATATVEVPLALEGYCPVVLNANEKWVPGNPAFYTMFHGHIFRFSSSEAMDKFMQNPTKYIPMAMGEDVVQMIDRNKHVYGSRKFGAWYKDRVFLFSSQESLDSFAAKPDFYTDIALKYEIALKNVHGRY